MSEAANPPGHITLSAPAELESIDLVQSAIAELWEHDGSVAAADRIRFEVAVVEIIGNIVEHAFRLDRGVTASSRLLDIDLGVEADRVVASFQDNGMPAEIDLSRVTMPDEDAESGRGLALAIAALDDLGYERVAGRNHWNLLCLRRGD
jgi:serine/threonine-protein kinase RsbW